MSQAQHEFFFAESNPMWYTSAVSLRNSCVPTGTSADSAMISSAYRCNEVNRMIETERLILRPFTEDDAADVLEYLKEPAVNCFACMKLNSLEEAKAKMKERAADEYYFAIELKETDKVIGEIFAHPEGEAPGDDAPKDTFSPCWMLNLSYTGKGYAYEAAHAFFDFLFNEAGARRIYAYTEDYNLPSQHLCERLGMRREGLYLEFVSFVNNPDGTPRYENTMEYAILKKEWRG